MATRPKLSAGTKAGLYGLLLLWVGGIGALVVVSSTKGRSRSGQLHKQAFNCENALKRMRECRKEVVGRVKAWVRARDAKAGVTASETNWTLTGIDVAAPTVLRSEQALEVCQYHFARKDPRVARLKPKLEACFRKPSCRAFARCGYDLRHEILRAR